MNISAFWSIVIIGLAGCLLSSCAYGPVWHDHLTKRPSRESLVGNYQLIYLSATEDVSRKIGGSVEERHQRPTVILKADGCFAFVNVPSFSRVSDAAVIFAGMSDATGHWSVAELGMAPDIFGRKAPYYGVLLDGADESMSRPGLDRSPHHHLRYTFAATNRLGAVMTFCPSVRRRTSS